MAKEWKKQEFILLLSKPDIGDEAMAKLVKTGEGEIANIREGVHAFHTNGDISLLSDMMKDMLGSRDSLVKCARCKTTF